MFSSSPQDESDFTLAQQVAITLVPAFSGTLSILGSSIIIWLLLQENRRRLKSVKYRFLLAICLSDIAYTLWLVPFALPIPKDTPGVWGAMGNKASCSAQGFFIQCGIIGSFYSCALSMYYYKSLCFSMRDDEIAKRYEKWIHIVAVVWPLGTATAALQQDLYSYTGVGCWIAPYPLRCHKRDGIDCIRGENAYLYAWLYMGIPFTFLWLYIIYSMWMIYLKVKEVSRRAEQWLIGRVDPSIVSNSTRVEVTELSRQSSVRDFSDGSAHNRSSNVAVVSHRGGGISGNDTRDTSRYAERTKEAATQAFLYVIAFFITRMWGFIVVLIEELGGTCPFYLLLIENFFLSMQGFSNVFIFLRPRIKSIQKRSPEISYFTAAYHSVFHYDEVRQRVTDSVLPPSRPDEESRPQSGTTSSTADYLQKSTGVESDASFLPALTKVPDTAGSPTEDLAKDSRPTKNEEQFQPVIHEEASAHHDVDGEPTIAKDSSFAQITGPNQSRHSKDDNITKLPETTMNN
jgi:hypothetical protein